MSATSADGSTMIDGDLFPIANTPPIASDELEAWNWDGVDIKVESQGYDKRPDSIQRKVIDQTAAGIWGQEYDIVFDDDDPGEAADVVGIRIDGSRLYVHLIHCKFSKERAPGARIGDLYEVCGQAQKSIRWRSRPVDLLRPS